MADLRDGITTHPKGFAVDGVPGHFKTHEEAVEAATEARLAEGHSILAASTVNLFEADTSTPRPFTPGMEGFMRPGTCAVWFGPRGEGKSSAALTACVDVVEAGGEVLYVDLENGWLRMGERLSDILSCRPEMVREKMEAGFEWWTYKDRSFDFRALSEPKVMAAWLELLKPVSLVVFDSWSKIFGQLGLNEEHNPDVQAFMERYVDPITAGGETSVLILDNTGHSESGRPRGGSAKLDLCELAYEVRGGQTCSREKHGTIRLKRTRHRDGDELRELELGFGGGRYGSIGPAVGDAPLDDVLRALGTEPLSKNAAYAAAQDAGVKMRKQDFIRQIDQWAAEPGSGLTMVDGKVVVL